MKVTLVIRFFHIQQQSILTFYGNFAKKEFNIVVTCLNPCPESYYKKKSIMLIKQGLLVSSFIIQNHMTHQKSDVAFRKRQSNLCQLIFW